MAVASRNRYVGTSHLEAGDRTKPAHPSPLMLCSIVRAVYTVVRHLQLCYGSTLCSVQRLNIPPCNCLCKKKTGGRCSNVKKKKFIICSLFSQCSLHMKMCSCLCTYGEQHNKTDQYRYDRVILFSSIPGLATRGRCCSRMSKAPPNMS